MDGRQTGNLAQMSDTDDALTLVTGQAWTLTPVYEGPGINSMWLDPYLIVVMNGHGVEPRLDVDLRPSGPLTLGIAQFEQMPVFLVKSPEFGTLDVAHPWIEGQPEPEIVPVEAVHILWHFVVVQQGLITSMHAFTTNKVVTQAVRRIFAEQRAHGPLTKHEAQAAVNRWQSFTVSEKQIWKRALATGKPGE